MPSPTTFSLSPRALAGAGLSLERLCQQAGVPPSTAWDTADFFRLWNAADALLQDPSAGLRFGTEGIARGYGVAAIVALQAPDFRHALAALSRYKRLTCPELVDVEVSGNDVAVRYRWLEAQGEVPRLLVDTTMASLLEMARRGGAGRIAPIRLELARRDTDRALLRRHFGCPIVFEAPHDAMVFERAALDTPFVTADGGAFANLLADLEKRLADGPASAGLVVDLRVAIARQLSEGRQPSIAAVATRIGASRRTLQRRLGELGTTFQQQLDGVRRTTASRLLANTALDAVAIALLLGFAEPNSFSRAFRAWENTTPARWRERQGFNPESALPS